jgi:hypothetical protein
VKRLIFAAALVLGLAPTALAEGAIPQPIYFWGSVAATISAPGQPPAPEVIRPTAIGIFADGSWDLQGLRWTGWGSSVAHAVGISSASNGIPNMAQGKRITSPAQVTLSNPGLFQGREVYRCFALTIPSHPASDEHGCVKLIGSVWLLGLTTQVTPSKGSTAPTTTKTAKVNASSFYSPIRGLSCEMDDHAGAVGVYCQSVGPPSHSVYMTLAGKLTICSGRITITTSDCLGNPGVGTPTLAYGKQVTVGPFRCRSQQAGVTCMLITSGKGFLITSAHITPVGGAPVASPRPLTPTAPRATFGAAFSPNPAGITCILKDDGTVQGAGVFCWLGSPWPPPTHVWMGPDGQYDETTMVAEPVGLGGPALEYGKSVTIGRFRCSSAVAGLSCVVVNTGKGFLISPSGITSFG